MALGNVISESLRLVKGDARSSLEGSNEYCDKDSCCQEQEPVMTLAEITYKQNCACTRT